jgi:hypothetical protein
MEPLAIAFVLFFFVTIVVGPILGAEDRPDSFARTASSGRWSLRCDAARAQGYSEPRLVSGSASAAGLTWVCSVMKRPACSRSSERPTVSAAATLPSSM